MPTGMNAKQAFFPNCLRKNSAGHHSKRPTNMWRCCHMPQQAWTPKRERQYEHIKEGLLEHGRNVDTAEEIAARTVNKERARAGEAKESSRLSRTDMSSGRRGGKRSGTSGPHGRTKEQLYQEAKRRNIKGRS